MNDLTTTEHQELTRHEAIIEHGLQTFTEVGNALLAIRDGRLYRRDYSTFEEYCQQRWNFTRMRASQLINAAVVVGNVNHGLQIPPPTTERQARPLTRLSPDQQREAWAQAVESAPLVNGKPKITGAHVMAVMGSSESPEWYTPPHIIELTLKLFGGAIDTDPCSNSKKIPNVPATFLYTKEDDGLAQTWHGAVYMNPPYGTEIPRWTEALIAKYENGEIREAIALLPGRIDTRWFQPLYDYLICHIRGRLNYPQSKSATPFPSVIVYLGDNRSAFIEVFKELGPIMRRVG